MKKHVLIWGILLFAMSFPLSAQSNFIDCPYIEVKGEAEKEIVPDEIYIGILLQESDMKQSVEQMERKMLEALKSLKIDTKDLSVNDLNSAFTRNWLKQGIRTSKKYTLKVPSAYKAAQVFQKLENLGISNLSIEKVDHSKIEDFKREVKVEAIRNAKEKATELAQAIGQTIGKAIYIQESSYYNRTPLFATRTLKSTVSDANEASDTANIDFRKIRLEYAVFVRFELK